jgi:hypothetical protein
MNERTSRFDDDGDLIVVAVAEPVEGHERASASRLACPVPQFPLFGIQPQAWECAPHV